jgi:hypothetical protein
MLAFTLGATLEVQCNVGGGLLGIRELYQGTIIIVALEAST